MRLLDSGLIYDAAAAPADRCCAAFTGLMSLAGGTILCTFKAGKEKLSPNDNVIIMRSRNGGASWEQICSGFPTDPLGVPGSYSSGYLFEEEPGRLMAALCWVDRSDPSLPLSNPDTTGLLDMRVFLAESRDGGATWGPLRELSMRPHPGVALTSEPIRLHNGSIFLPYESWKDWNDEEGTHRAAARLSFDGGATWPETVIMGSHPQQQRFYWDNRLAKDPRTGRLVAMYWTHDPTAGLDVDITIQWSDSEGRNWSIPEPTGIAGQIASPLVLDDNRLLCVYVHRHNPPSIRALVSSDLGKTWDQANEIVLYDSTGGREAGTSGPRIKAEYWADMYRWTFGHPKAIKLPNGNVLAAWYGGKPDALSMHWGRIEV
jgi:hypothetical protein